MKRKYIFSIIICIILIILTIFVTTNFHNSNEIKVDDIYFTLPYNYQVGLANTAGDTNITDGTHTIYISKCYTDKETNMNSYLTSIQKKNFTYETSTLNSGDICVNKISVGNNTNTTHYWFTLNGKTYTVYSWDNYDNLDYIVLELIKSSRNNLFF